MKHILLSTALILGSLTAASAIAQTSTPDAAPTQQRQHHRNPHKQAMHLQKELGLSPDQTSRLEPILAQRHDAVQALRQNTTLTPDQRRTQMRELNRNVRQQMTSVLTPEQMQQLASMRKQHHTHNNEAVAAPAGA